ncbi:hypothetical protein ACF073_25130 [Streptomyces sp. NPDC015171]|uniref:hypothetical protein n=1 Tax=Streptomyces sp. NPDC015171 TaxID=3364945 RepID=UPI0036F8D061
MAVTSAGYDTTSDTAFFAEITDVFRKHPEAAGKYALASLAVERELDVDYARQYGVSRIEGGRVITEFHDRDSDRPVIRARLCVKYELRGQELKCVHWMEAEE